jgi:predicted methyltransferase
MTEIDYPACLRELIESEIFGEAVSLALLEVAKSERDRYQFSTLLQLETETKARLRPLLYKHGIALTEERPTEQVEEVVQGYIAARWEDFAAANKEVVQNFLSRFEQIAEAGPAEDREILLSMIRHETAILRWFDMESRGETEGSLDDIIRELKYPIPA